MGGIAILKLYSEEPSFQLVRNESRVVSDRVAVFRLSNSIRILKNKNVCTGVTHKMHELHKIDEPVTESSKEKPEPEYT